MKERLKQRDRIIIANLSICLVVFLLYQYAIQPGLGQLKEIGQNVENELSLLKKLERKGGQEKLKQSIAAAETTVNDLSQYFIADEIGFVTKVENTASDLELTERLVMGTPAPFGKYRKIPATLYTQGSLREQMMFIERLDNMKYFINLKSVEMSPENNKKGEPLVNMTLVADTYWQNNEN